MQPLHPLAFIDAAIETVTPAAIAKDIRLERVLDPAAGPISGDPGRLQQVVWNLLSNAIKFTPRGGTVQVALQRNDAHVEIAVADSGIGIEPALLPHLFERFRQGDASTTRRYGGLGLGLSLVKSLVELHGGTVGVTSPGEGLGTTVTVHLPLAILHGVGGNLDGDERAPLRAPLPVRADELAGVKVLVVDDEPDARELIARVLEDAAAIVLSAASADEAIELVEAERPDVLVSDIGMPDVDGYELLRRVRALGPSAAAASRHRAHRVRAHRGPDACPARRLRRPRLEAGRGLRAGRHGGQRRRPRRCSHWVALTPFGGRPPPPPRPGWHRSCNRRGMSTPRSFPSSNLDDPYDSRDTGLDDTIESSFPASDPPSTIPDPTTARARATPATARRDRQAPRQDIEQQAARLPSDPFLWAAIGSMGVSAALQASGKKHASLFVGQWAPAFLLLGIYDRLVRGSSDADR